MIKTHFKTIYEGLLYWCVKNIDCTIQLNVIQYDLKEMYFNFFSLKLI